MLSDAQTKMRVRCRSSAPLSVDHPNDPDARPHCLPRFLPPNWRHSLLGVLFIILLISVTGTRGENGPELGAPNPGFQPVNQLRVSGNACGPAALLSAFGFGSEKWQEPGKAVKGDGDRARITYVIRGYGMRKSAHLERPRWNKTSGVGLLDLTDIANEMRGSRWLPTLRNEVLILGSRETQTKLLKRTHSRIAKSLKSGFPPIVSLQRLAMRGNGSGPTKSWHVVHGHFVVIIGLPAKLPRNATSIPIRYADPWGGRILEGTLRADPNAGYPAIIADTPETKVGKRYLKDGEASIVTLAAVIGVL
jgi:hypothetical protein